jgi:hypothetical protein
MKATAMFHRLTRGALAAKRWLGARKHVDAEVHTAFLSALDGAAVAEDARAWASELAHVASPPRGKLTDLVFARIATHLGLPEAEARQLVVGVPRRARRSGA